jgi:hypothetical protein
VLGGGFFGVGEKRRFFGFVLIRLFLVFLGVFDPFLALFRGGSEMGFLGTFRSEELEKTESFVIYLIY